MTLVWYSPIMSDTFSLFLSSSSPQIPKSLLSHYCEFVSANPKSRPNPTVLLGSLREHGGYLSNPFVSIALRIEELQVCV